MWFTDVLGFLKSVAVAPAELEGAFAEGMGFDGSAIEGFARVYESDMVAHPDPSTFQVLPWRDRAQPRRGCSVTSPCRTGHPLRGPSVRPQASAEEGRGPRLHLLHPPGGGVLPVQGPGQTRQVANAGRPVRLLRPHPAEPGHRLPPQGDHDAGADGHLGGVLPPRGRARPAGDRSSLRRCAVDRRQHS